MAADSNVALNFMTAEVEYHRAAGGRLPADHHHLRRCEQMNALVLCSGHNPPECLYPVDGVIAYQAHRDSAADQPLFGASA
ncbi:hypothetical protein M8494_28585 [Serratia ureilytica]